MGEREREREVVGTFYGVRNSPGAPSATTFQESGAGGARALIKHRQGRCSSFWELVPQLSSINRVLESIFTHKTVYSAKMAITLQVPNEYGYGLPYVHRETCLERGVV